MIEKGAHEQALDRMKGHPHFAVLKQITNGMEKNKEQFLGHDLVVYEESDAHGEKWVTGLGCSDELDYDEYAIKNEDGEFESSWETWERVVDGVFNEYLSNIAESCRVSYTVDM
jgi:hypothetical protein